MSSRPSSPPSEPASEQTPLLSRPDEELSFRQTNGTASPVVASPPSVKRKAWRSKGPTIVALSVLSIAVLAILCIGFAAPAVVQEYAKEALVVEPENLSIESFTSSGIRARIQATCSLDASRVRRKPVRDLGRLFTWIAKEVESGGSEVKVTLPEYGGVLLGTAEVPPVKLNVRNQHYNRVDVLTDLEPGDIDGVRTIARDWMEGRLGSLRVQAVADVHLKSGIFSLGRQTIMQQITFAGDDVPAFPDFDIQKLRFEEFGEPGKPSGMRAMAKVSVMNAYPVTFDVPALNFDVLLPDCFEEYLMLGQAKTERAHILPKRFVNVSVTGMIRQLPTPLTTTCPGSSLSPLDDVLRRYLKGQETFVYVRGSSHNDEAPDWVTDLLRGTVLPIPLPGHPFDNLIKNFSLANVHFSLPDPLAEPDTPDAKPRISAIVKALVGLPTEMNFNLDVDHVKADADVFYKGDKLGELDLSQWQPSRTTKLDSDLLIESAVENAPLTITDEDVFTSLVQELIFGEGVSLGVHANVDINTITALGEFVVRKIPAKGKIFIKAISKGFTTPSVGNLKILDTAKSSVTLSATINVTNPTEYSARIPYVNVSISTNDTEIGYASAQADVVPGMNSVEVTASLETNKVGRELLSQILSGRNTTLTLSTHSSSIPLHPRLGKALSGLKIVVSTPKFFGKFLKEATVSTSPS